MEGDDLKEKLREAAGTMYLRVVLAMAILTVVIAAVSCGFGSGPTVEPAGQESVSGFIQEVEARSLLELGSLTIVDQDGIRWTFEAGDADLSGFTPSHLRDHMLSGVPVTVTFHREDGEMVIDSLSD